VFVGVRIFLLGLFPINSAAWEINYRGELDFLHQALAQQQSHKLRVEDGWLYFVHGGTEELYTSTMQIDPSVKPDARYLPCGEKAREFTFSARPSSLSAFSH
jgi:shikimate 5-dehydrogenase